MKSTIADGVICPLHGRLGGCSSMRDKSTVAKPYDIDDADYVAQVESMAAHRGVSVQWVNPPQKHVVNQ